MEETFLRLDISHLVFDYIVMEAVVGLQIVLEG